MLVLTFNTVVKCSHDGIVQNRSSQDWLTITEPSADDSRAKKPTPVLIRGASRLHLRGTLARLLRARGHGGNQREYDCGSSHVVCS